LRNGLELEVKKTQIDGQRLADGIRELRLKDGSIISSRTTKTDGEFVYPYLFSAQLSHPDNIVSGRRWITEIGLRQEQQNHTIECTILLKTDEVSPRVTAAITVTRPKLIEHLVKNAIPAGIRPG
jgi:hypothetical protein